jgi:hypothetical protein
MIIPLSCFAVFEHVIAQRLAAQPLGHIRVAVTILTGILKSHFNVLSLSLGQVARNPLLGLIFDILIIFIPISIVSVSFPSHLFTFVCKVYSQLYL